MTERYKPEGYHANSSENFEHFSSLSAMEYALSTGMILEARALLCDSEHNLIVDLGAYKGIIPRSEAAYNPDGSDTRDIAIISRVGKSVCFKFTGIDKTGEKPKIILSRKAAQVACFDHYLSTLKQGDIVDAKITHIEPFGCFCDIGCGMISLLPVDCISVSRISHPKDRFSCGDFLKCAVKYKDTKSGRITLTHKELLGTWEENAAGFTAGETAAGIIRSIEPYGIFVELAPNLAGLAEWCEDAKVGHMAAVYIKSILPEKMKIKLVIVDSDAPCVHTKNKPTYFFTDEHIDFWQYSPKDCEKQVYTDFTKDY